MQETHKTPSFRSAFASASGGFLSSAVVRRDVREAAALRPAARPAGAKAFRLVDGGASR